MSISSGYYSLLSQPIVNNYQESNLFFNKQESNPAKSASHCTCYIIPPHITKQLNEVRSIADSEKIKNLSLKNLKVDRYLRAKRETHIQKPAHTQEANFTFPWHKNKHTPPPPVINFNLNQVVYNAQHFQQLPGKTIYDSNWRMPGKIDDASVQNALDNALNVYQFYLDNYKQRSIDGYGMDLLSTVHYGENYENAFWNGKQMVYGDGSEVFDEFVKYLDVVGHEMTHGITGNYLDYQGEAGALNEHMSDVMGYLVKLYKDKLATNDPKATWTIADGIIKDGKNRYPLRSFAAPGTAYETSLLGKDPQPAKYPDLYKGVEDEGGVHLNSGIPNHAFYLFAQALGGNAWEKAGFIWFRTLKTPGLFKPNASMKEFAKASILIGKQLFPQDAVVENALRSAWKTVQVIL